MALNTYLNPADTLHAGGHNRLDHAEGRPQHVLRHAARNPEELAGQARERGHCVHHDHQHEAAEQEQVAHHEVEEVDDRQLDVSSRRIHRGEKAVQERNQQDRAVHGAGDGPDGTDLIDGRRRGRVGLARRLLAARRPQQRRDIVEQRAQPRQAGDPARPRSLTLVALQVRRLLGSDDALDTRGNLVEMLRVMRESVRRLSGSATPPITPPTVPREYRPPMKRPIPPKIASRKPPMVARSGR